MSKLNQKGPENEGPGTGRGLGKCNPENKGKGYGKGMGLRRKANDSLKGKGLGQRRNKNI